MQFKNWESLKIALIYFAISFLWIIFSDKLLLLFTSNIDTLSLLQTFKGWFFVIASSFVLYFLVKREILIKKETEKNLDLEHTKYKTLFETANDAIFIIDENDQFIDCNEKTLKYAQCSKDQLIGKTPFDISPEIQGEQKSEFIGKEMIQKARQGEPQFFEWEYLNLDKTKKYHSEISLGRMPVGNKNLVLGIVRNISDKKNAEKTLQESEERYRKQYDYFPIPIFTVKKKNDDFYFADVNNAVKKSPYIKSENIIGKKLTEFFYREEDKEYFNGLNEVLKTKKIKSINTEYEFKTTGIKRNLNIIAGYIPDETILLSLFDITGSKEAERKLKESEEKFRMHFNNMPIPTYTWQKVESDFILTEYNDAAKKETKGIVDKDIGKKLSEIYQHRKDIIQDIETCFENKEVILKEMNYKTQDGDEKILEVTYVPIPQNNVIVHTNNITTRKLIEKALKNSEEKYRRLTENSPDITYIYSMNHGAVYWSSRVKEILGFDPNNLKIETLKWDEAIHRDDKAKIEEFFKNIEPGKTYELEYRIYDTKHQMHWFKDRIFNVYQSNGDILLEGLISDVTDLKNSHNKVFHAMMNAEERERARVAKELHDGVSPILSAIKLYIQTFLIAKKQEVKVDISEKIFNTINDAIQSVSDISNKLSPHILKNFGLSTALQSYIEKISETTSIHFSFLCNIKQDLDKSIEVNLYRIIIELINNTVKYGSARNIVLKINEKKDSVNMYFEHNGKGFDMDEVSGKSKGMGLYNMRNRINSINGVLNIKTSLTEGLSVNVSIPKED